MSYAAAPCHRQPALEEGLPLLIGVLLIATLKIGHKEL